MEKDNSCNERLLLKEILKNGNLFFDVSGLISKDCFRDPVNKAIFEAMGRIYEAGSVITFKFVKDYFNDPDVYSHLLEIYKSKDTLSSVYELASELKNVYFLDTVEKGVDKIKALDDKLSVFDKIINEKRIIEDLSILSNDINSYEDRSMYLSDFYTELTDEISNPPDSLVLAPNAFSTGFVGLDAAIKGLSPGSIFVLGAPSGTGKTSFALNLASNAVDNNVYVLYFSLEMSPNSIFKRFVSSKLDTSFSDLISIRNYADKVKEGIADGNILQAETDRSKNNKKFCLWRNQSLTVEDIGLILRRKKRQHNIKLVVIDHLQIIEPSKNLRSKSEVDSLRHKTRAVQKIAITEGVAIILVSQLNKASYLRNNKRPNESDLYGSQTITNDADYVALLYRPGILPASNDGQFVPPKSYTELIIVKTRVGEQSIMEYEFKPETMSFKEIGKIND